MAARGLNTIILSIAILALVLVVPALAFDLPSIPGGGSIPIPGAGGLVKDKPAISTSIKDAVTEVPFLDAFTPQSFAPMTWLDRGPNNGFVLNRPGLYELHCWSYCLNAGTYGPSKGDGYVYARLAGPRADVIRKIARGTVDHPEITQHDAQSLIWGILSKTKISEMSDELQTAARALLSSSEIKDLNGGALGMIPDEVMEQVLGNLPPAARRVMEAESELRGLLSSATTPFEELEAVAVLSGEHEPGEGSREIPDGRWSYHPDGFFLRFFPSGYSQTLIQLYLPEPFTVARDDKKRITSVSDNRGCRIEIEYDDSDGLACQGDSAVSAYALRLIRFVRPRAIGPEIVVSDKAEWANVGWTLAGVPSGNGSAESTERFANLKDRYSAVVAMLRQTDEMARKAAKLKDPKSAAPSLSREDLADLAHLSVAVREAIGESAAQQGDWVADHALLPMKAWQRMLCKSLGTAREFASARTYQVASTALVGLLIGADDGPCDNQPGGSPNSPEYDPTDGTATPGDTDDQRLLPSGKPDDSKKSDDCGKVGDALKGLESVRKAFQDTVPQPGESGPDYAKRVEGSFGAGQPGGAVAPMATHMGCGIEVNEAFYNGRPPIERAADCAHEKVHQVKCRWARDNYTGGFGSWVDNAANYRQNELDAYQAGIDMLKNWQQQNGCGN